MRLCGTSGGSAGGAGQACVPGGGFARLLHMKKLMPPFTLVCPICTCDCVTVPSSPSYFSVHVMVLATVSTTAWKCPAAFVETAIFETSAGSAETDAPPAVESDAQIALCECSAELLVSTNDVGRTIPRAVVQQQPAEHALFGLDRLGGDAQARYFVVAGASPRGGGIEDCAHGCNVRRPTLVARASRQNFVPVVDDREVFIGIVRRQTIIEHCARRAGIVGT